ncbi:MAG: hypothetical protein IAE81_13300 [Caldilineaceae bacterium]|jgi:hypothetical protein|nr:hypothetical protein [Caldilineaceae bacterium]
MTTTVNPVAERTVEHKHQPCAEKIWGDEMPRTLDVLDLEAPDRELTYAVCDCCQQWAYCHTLLIDKDGLPVGQRAFCPDCWSKYARN